MKGKATPIREVAKDVIKRLSRERSKKEDKIKKSWQRAVGKRFYEHTQPVSFRKKRLVVNVDSSSLLYELTIRKEKISSRLKKDLKGDFKEVRFRIGEIEG